MNNNSRLLVTYISNSGSTAEVAERIAEKISASYESVHVLPIADVGSLDGYTGVVIGGPMILGWHRKAYKFVMKHRATLNEIPFHVFMTAMEVTGETPAEDSCVFVDPKILETPADPSKLSFKEKHTTIGHYTAALFKGGRTPKPARIAIFAGKLDYTKLKFPQMLFVMLIIGAKPGDRRNWKTIDTWTQSLEFLKHGGTSE